MSDESTLFPNSVRTRLFALRVWDWLRHPWPLWLATALLCLLWAGLGIWKPCDLTYRMIGMVMQVSGVSTAIWGLLAIRVFFGLKPYRRTLGEWWARRPRWNSSYTMAADAGAYALEGNDVLLARSSVTFDRTKSVEERLNALTDAVEGLHKSLGSIDVRHSDRAEALANELKTLAARSDAQTTDVAERLKRAQTGSASLSLAGAALLLAGVVLTSIPVELAYYLGNPVPVCAFP